MWWCVVCKREFDDVELALKVIWGFVDSEKVKNENDQYFAFTPKYCAVPLCRACAVSYIRAGPYVCPIPSPWDLPSR